LGVAAPLSNSQRGSRDKIKVGVLVLSGGRFRSAERRPEEGPEEGSRSPGERCLAPTARASRARLGSLTRTPPGRSSIRPRPTLSGSCSTHPPGGLRLGLGDALRRRHGHADWGRRGGPESRVGEEARATVFAVLRDPWLEVPERGSLFGRGPLDRPGWARPLPKSGLGSSPIDSTGPNSTSPAPRRPTGSGPSPGSAPPRSSLPRVSWGSAIYRPASWHPALNPPGQDDSESD
jgi:hypothetical protein